STVLERNITDPEERAKLPRYYAEEEHPEKYVKKDARKTKPEKAGILTEKAETGKTESTEKVKAPGTLKNPRIIITRGNAGSR
ncbi:MAG: hypothetical protein NC305_10920, partial [Lachnospiraceae bacterium]|nr:hypothetical protein [Lachnospiraceae bacterium]